MDNKRCVCCGAPLDWERRLSRGGSGDPAVWAGWERRTFSAFGAGAVASVPAGVEWERRRPVRSVGLESDVIAPGLQSTISGLVAGVVATVGATAAAWPRPALVGVGVGAGVLGVVWFALLRLNRGLLWEVERVTGKDLDGDGLVGDPAPRETRVEVVERGNGRTRMRFVDVPLSDHELERLARAVLVRRERFSRRGLSEVLSQSQYQDVYQRMIDGGLLRPDGRGVELSPSGRAFLGQYLDG